MQQFARMDLYQWLRDGIGETISPVFVEMSLQNLIQVNLELLNGIEEHFLTQDLIGSELADSGPDDEYRDPDWWPGQSGIFDYNQPPDRRLLAEIFARNLENAQRLLQNDAGRRLIRILSQMLSDLQQREGPYEDTRYFFNHLIRQLSALNVRVLESPMRMDNKMATWKALDLDRENRIQVFCSHAYKDHLYTYALFHYLYHCEQIYLYLDWMHNAASTDGSVLKAMLQKELKRSEQLLFIRTLNSELKIRGQSMIRGWCSWELGNYYGGLNGSEKYLLNLYSLERYDRYDNLQLHGLKILYAVHDGRLHGKRIK